MIKTNEKKKKVSLPLQSSTLERSAKQRGSWPGFHHLSSVGGVIGQRTSDLRFRSDCWGPRLQYCHVKKTWRRMGRLYEDDDGGKKRGGRCCLVSREESWISKAGSLSLSRFEPLIFLDFIPTNLLIPRSNVSHITHQFARSTLAKCTTSIYILLRYQQQDEAGRCIRYTDYWSRARDKGIESSSQASYQTLHTVFFWENHSDNRRSRCSRYQSDQPASQPARTVHTHPIRSWGRVKRTPRTYMWQGAGMTIGPKTYGSPYSPKPPESSGYSSKERTKIGRSHNVQ